MVKVLLQALLVVSSSASSATGKWARSRTSRILSGLSSDQEMVTAPSVSPARETMARSRLLERVKNSRCPFSCSMRTSVDPSSACGRSTWILLVSPDHTSLRWVLGLRRMRFSAVPDCGSWIEDGAPHWLQRPSSCKPLDCTVKPKRLTRRLSQWAQCVSLTPSR